MSRILFPAEWYPQSGVQLTWPHGNTDWADDLDAVINCYLSIGKEIVRRQKLLVICPDRGKVESHFTEEEQRNLVCVEITSDDTWARDHAPISLFVEGKPTILDFGFNGWGLKFAARHDNQITGSMYAKNVFLPQVEYQCHLNFILEGGAIESDGKGTILTTAECLLAPNRNQPRTQYEIEEYLKDALGASRILWLHHGFLEGDDTDSHVDTLARFCDEHTIAYVKCDDVEDVHYQSLKSMEEELHALKTFDGRSYRLIDLPMADAIFDEGMRLPATYANFLVINGAVLIPFYGSEKDLVAQSQLQKAFPDREMVGIDCRPLVRQHGSLHCVTMQYPMGFL